MLKKDTLAKKVHSKLERLEIFDILKLQESHSATVPAARLPYSARNPLLALNKLMVKSEKGKVCYDKIDRTLVGSSA